MKSHKQPEISLVVPAYNEEERIPLMLSDVAALFKPKDTTHEIIVVNDGSKDQTSKVALE